MKFIKEQNQLFVWLTFKINVRIVKEMNKY